MTEASDAVKRIKAKLLGLGPLLPGSLGQQWNVCGTPGCQCKDPKHPRRHGPYYQLSYTLQGRSSTVRRAGPNCRPWAWRAGRGACPEHPAAGP